MAYTLYSNLDWIDLPDCMGLLEDGKCAYLTVPSCQGASCPFCKTRESHAQNLMQAYGSIASRDEGLQKRIAGKYYQGRRPWLK